MNTWEAIFSQSPVNQGYYNEAGLPQNHWGWPRGTWFQSRLDFIRDQERISNTKPETKPYIRRQLRSM
ncbi:MAG TPA: hypothetical protein VF452_20635 [Candidatus Binatia bacterium]